jgi:hypothetical protein
MLMKGRKAGEFLTDKEQQLVVARLLGCLEALAEQEQVLLSEGCQQLCRKKELSEAGRKTFVRLAKKYREGMDAATAHHGSDYKELESRFARGEFDAAVHATTSPAMTGRFWDWVKEWEAKKQDSQFRAVQDQLSSAAASAAEQAVQLFSEAEALKLSHAGENVKQKQELADKLMAAYMRAVQAHHHGLAGELKEKASLAEELWCKHQDLELRLRQEAVNVCVRKACSYLLPQQFTLLYIIIVSRGQVVLGHVGLVRL